MEETFYEKTIAFLKEEISSEGSHDIYHCIRVYRNSCNLLKYDEAMCNPSIIYFGSLLHDVIDRKICRTTPEEAKQRVVNFLIQLSIHKPDIEGILFVIENVSFSTEINSKEIYQSESHPFLHELYIVQDADRLDAIGAIGIARAFAYGGSKNRSIFNTDAKSLIFESFHLESSSSTSSEACISSSEKSSIQIESFIDKLREPDDIEEIIGQPIVTKADSSTIQHFFDKLLHITSMMKTASGKKIAEKRHKIMIDYLINFFNEWEGIS